MGPVLDLVALGKRSRWEVRRTYLEGLEAEQMGLSGVLLGYGV